MSSDEPVEDPYHTLGVPKDADISAIRSAHRKLVLKYHPDRLQGEEEQAKGKDAFQKVQQAYEILSDPTTRARHDNKVKLAQLRKEAMTRDPPPRTAAYPMRPPPPSTPNREYRDGKVYEERAPSYFDEGYRYRDEEPRTTSRKYDGYERERRPDFGQPEKERKSTKWPEKTASELPFGIALKFKAKAQKTRDAVKEKAREKEMHASSAKSRDRDHRSARMDKQSSRRAYVEDDDSSDSDTATYVTVNGPSPRPSKSPYDSTPQPRSKPEPPRRSTLTWMRKTKMRRTNGIVSTGLPKNTLNVHKDPVYPVGRVLLERIGNLERTDNQDERVVVTVTSDLSRQRAGDHPLMFTRHAHLPCLHATLRQLV